MKFLMALLVCLVVLAVAVAAPLEEGVLGDIAGSDTTNPQDPNSFLKLLLLKKKLLLLG